MNRLEKLKKDLRKYQRPEKTRVLQRFFKTGPGEYAEGDIFLGLKTAETVGMAKKYLDLSFPELKNLLSSKIHEERSVALFILKHQFDKGGIKEKERVYNFYLKNLSGVNNWDLVDGSADKIVGAYLDISGKSKKIIYQLAKSDVLWEKRIAIMATFHFIKKGEFKDTLKISEMLIDDKEDLIHKAVGWMLREIGKRDLKSEEVFLKKNYQKMPRTMLRYAIERFPERKRQAYLKGKI